MNKRGIWLIVTVKRNDDDKAKRQRRESHLEVIEQVTEREFDLGPTNRLSAHVRTPQVDRTRKLPLILSV